MLKTSAVYRVLKSVCHIFSFLLRNAVFRLERATEVTDTLVNTAQDNRKLTKVKVRFALRKGMVKVGNQGLDDRYIRLRSHRISNPVVSGLRQAHSITFSRPGFRD